MCCISRLIFGHLCRSVGMEWRTTERELETGAPFNYFEIILSNYSLSPASPQTAPLIIGTCVASLLLLLLLPLLLWPFLATPKLKQHHRAQSSWSCLQPRRNGQQMAQYRAICLFALNHHYFFSGQQVSLRPLSFSFSLGTREARVQKPVQFIQQKAALLQPRTPLSRRASALTNARLPDLLAS